MMFPASRPVDDAAAVGVTEAGGTLERDVQASPAHLAAEPSRRVRR